MVKYRMKSAAQAFVSRTLKKRGVPGHVASELATLSPETLSYVLERLNVTQKSASPADDVPPAFLRNLYSSANKSAAGDDAPPAWLANLYKER